MKYLLAILCFASLIFANDVLTFWFSESKPMQWFVKDPAFDQIIKTRFEKSVTKASMDTLEPTPESYLAHIILLDQFPRNIYRNSPKAFAFDALACVIAMQGIEKGYDQKLAPLMRAFFYMPLEHAEDLSMQDKSVALFRALAQEAPGQCQGFYRYAESHRKIIARFGRYPHRNKILNRESTPEELAFLTQPGSSF